MKSERLHLRISPEKKAELQAIADRHYNGSISALIDKLIDDKIEQEEGDDNE